ncbi:hypothetical protein B0A77_08955 [Flavobacterium branchiophilum]|uniref:Leucine-rich repeat domain-containing protein n=2 Tax=Flavobacterium branchiophilum TaxID=55197 RepID=A0A2H3KB07_9FLAO|nr:hypothetical protein B0A77_08955 [Flavobacterium branchiophilum]
MEKIQINKNNNMKNQIYLCEIKGRKFIDITNEERIHYLVESSRDDKRSDFEKYLQRDDPPGFNEYKAKKFDSIKDVISKPISISFDLIQEIDFDYLEEQLKDLEFESINFVNSKLDLLLPENITKNVKTFFCNGNSKGIIDLSKFCNLKYVNLLKWNNKVIFKGNNSILTNIIVWYYNPKSKSLKDILADLKSIEYLEFNLTNIESLEGIEQLVSLKKIVINYGRNLKSVKNLNLCKKLEHIQFNNCKKIEDFELLDNKKGLKIENIRLPG